MMQQKFDQWMQLKTPVYIMEGYADDFDFEKYKSNYLANDTFMNSKSGLYNKYHLYIAYLMEKKGYDFKKILKKQPPLEILEELK